MTDKTEREAVVCPKCKATSGNDWDCGSDCPMPMNPNRAHLPAKRDE